MQLFTGELANLIKMLIYNCKNLIFHFNINLKKIHLYLLLKRHIEIQVFQSLMIIQKWKNI